MNKHFQPEWRTQNRSKRKFYAKYLRWIERGGYFVVLCVFAAFIFAFNYPVEDLIKADGVVIQAESVGLSSKSDCLVVEVIAPDFSEVKAGQPLVRIVEGADQIELYQEFQAIETLRKSGRAVGISVIAPKGRILVAPNAGTFHLVATDKTVPAEETVAKIIDYSRLVMQADLEGTTVAQAAVNQSARISGINLGSDSASLFRGDSPQGDLVSGAMMSPEVKAQIEAELKGMSVKARDDQPLAVDGVKFLQIDAGVDLVGPTGMRPTIQADPPLNFTVKGIVEEGNPFGTLQIAGLPGSLAKLASDDIEASAQRSNFRNASGQEVSIGKVRNPQYVVQLTVKGAAKPEQTTLPGTVISRKFAAKVRLNSPPQFLLDAVRNADRAGKTVTARVEVVTGTRPIALILLKKS